MSKVLSIRIAKGSYSDLLSGVELSSLSRLNLLTGVNGAGKSTLLREIHKSLELSLDSDGRNCIDWWNSKNPLVEEMSSSCIVEFARNRLSEWPNGEANFKFPGYPLEKLKAIVNQIDKESPASKVTFFVPDFHMYCVDLLSRTFGEKAITFEEKEITIDGEQLLTLASLFGLSIQKSFRSVLITESRMCLPCEPTYDLKQDGISDFNLVAHLFNLKSQRRDSSEWIRFNRLDEDFKKVSNLKFDIVKANGGSELSLHFSYGGKSAWVNKDQTGKGYEDLLVLLYWLTEPRIEMVLIEEIEAHMHPRLIHSLASYISEIKDRICIASTHSPDLLRTSVPKKIFWLQCKNEKNLEGIFSPRITATDKSSEASMLKELGMQPLEYFAAKILVLIEGHTDEIAIREFLRKKGYSLLHDVCFIHLGGDSMVHANVDQWTMQFDVLALVDGDPKSASARKDFCAKCCANNVPITQLKRYSLESYFSLSAYAEVFPDIASKLPVIFSDDVSVEKQIGRNPKGNIEHLARLTSAESLEGTDINDFLIKLIQKLDRLSLMRKE